MEPVSRYCLGMYCLRLLASLFIKEFDEKVV